jgi:hypothetical protein
LFRSLCATVPSVYYLFFMCFMICFIFWTMLQSISGITGKLFWWTLWNIFLIQCRLYACNYWKFCGCFLFKKGELLNQDPNIMDFDKSEICPCFFYGSNMCYDSYKIYEKHKYELLLNGHKMSESVEIVKSTIFYLIGMCPHLFLLNAYLCSWTWNYTLECFHCLRTFLE